MLQQYLLTLMNAVQHLSYSPIYLHNTFLTNQMEAC